MEDELQRIRLRYNDICDDNQRLRTENHGLHVLLQQNGVRLPPHLATAMLEADSSQNHSPLSVGAYLGGGGPQSASTHQTGFTPSPGPTMSATSGGANGMGMQGMSTPSPPSQHVGMSMGMRQQGGSPGAGGQAMNGGGLDYDQIGVDMVLTYVFPLEFLLLTWCALPLCAKAITTHCSLPQDRRRHPDSNPPSSPQTREAVYGPHALAA